MRNVPFFQVGCKLHGVCKNGRTIGRSVGFDLNFDATAFIVDALDINVGNLDDNVMDEFFFMSIAALAALVSKWHFYSVE